MPVFCRLPRMIGRCFHPFLRGRSQRAVKEEAPTRTPLPFEFKCSIARAIKIITAENIFGSAETKYFAKLLKDLTNIGITEDILVIVGLPELIPCKGAISLSQSIILISLHGI